MQKISLALVKNSQNTISEQWYDKDVWYYSDLGITDTISSERAISFTFKRIDPPWLKEITKQHIKMTSMNKSVAYVKQIIATIVTFSAFLRTQKGMITPVDLDRNLIIGYIRYLKKRNLSSTTQSNRLCTLSEFLNICIHNNLLPEIKTTLIFKEDIPQSVKKIPRFIPETVLSQLNSKLHLIHPQLRRIISVLLETGMRINELIKLNFNCIFQDQEKDYFLKYNQSKFKKDHVIPISQDLANIIIEQQKAVKKEWGRNKLLFPVPTYMKYDYNKISRRQPNRGKHWYRRSIVNHLNIFAQKHNILGPDNKVWHFNLHSFRHTVATRMINNSVPQHIVQRFMGHESPVMTSRYAHIFDQTLKEAFAKFSGKMIDITGESVSSKQIVANITNGVDPDSIDAQWLKKNIMAQTLPNGICVLPVVSNKCPHANSCLTCANFRTDRRYLHMHYDQLKKTEKVIATAKANCWKRQEEMNITIKNNLKNIIQMLEKKDDSQT